MAGRVAATLVHGDVLKGAFFDVGVESLKGGLLSWDVCLQFLAVGASSDILFNKGA